MGSNLRHPFQEKPHIPMPDSTTEANGVAGNERFGQVKGVKYGKDFFFKAREPESSKHALVCI